VKEHSDKKERRDEKKTEQTQKNRHTHNKDYKKQKQQFPYLNSEVYTTFPRPDCIMRMA